MHHYGRGVCGTASYKRPVTQERMPAEPRALRALTVRKATTVIPLAWISATRASEVGA
jgi:hypothetical protein